VVTFKAHPLCLHTTFNVVTFKAHPLCLHTPFNVVTFKAHPLCLHTTFNVVTFKAHPLCLHTPFPPVLHLFVAFLERILWDVFKACVTDIWMSSVDSKWRPFTADFTF
jgi:hypothetical protein